MCFSPFRPLRSTKKCTQKGCARSSEKTSCTPFVYKTFYCILRARRAYLYIGLAPVCYTFIWFSQIKAVKSRNIFIFCFHFYTYTSYCFDDVYNEHRMQRYKVLLEVTNNAAKNVPAPALT